MCSSAERARAEAVLTDSTGRTYVAIPPGYGHTAAGYRAGLVGRAAILACAALAFVLLVVSMVVPFFSGAGYEVEAREYHTMWRSWTTVNGTTTYRAGSGSPYGIVAAVGAVFAAVAVALAATHVALLVAHARERCAEERGSARAMAACGRRRWEGSDDGVAADSFPYANLRVVNAGLVRGVPCEARELHRRRCDRDVCAAALSMLIFAFVFTVLALSVSPFSMYSERGWASRYPTQLHAGFALLLLSCVLCLCGFVLAAIPSVTKARLCGALRPERCLLMVVADTAAAEAGVWAELRQQAATGNPLLVAAASGDVWASEAAGVRAVKGSVLPPGAWGASE